MDKTIRNPRYLVPLAVLAAVTVVALAVAAAQPGEAEGRPSQAVVPAATALPTPAPAQSAADARRLADLRTLAGLLETYRSENAAYPSTQMYFNTVCTQAFDAGCLLTTISKQIPTGDGASAYWYRSDGATYTVFARADAAPTEDNCPAELPPVLAGGPVICLTSGGGR